MAKTSRKSGLGTANHRSMILQQRVLSRQPTGSQGWKIVNLSGRIEGRAGAFPACSRPLTIPYNCKTVNYFSARGNPGSRDFDGPSMRGPTGWRLGTSQG